MKQATPTRIAGVSGFILILTYLFFFLKRVDVSLIYYWQQSISLSFGESMKYPGGISDHLGDWFIEFLTRPFTGYLAVAVMVTIVFISLLVIFRRANDNPLYLPLVLAALVPFILLFAYYRLPVGLTMGIATGLFIGAVQSLYSPRNLVIRSIYHFITGIVIYLVAGAAGFAVLLQAILVQTVLEKRTLALVSVLPLLAIPLLYLPFNVAYTLRVAYLGSFLVSKYDMIPTILYFSLSSPLLVLLFLSGLHKPLSQLARRWQFILSGIGTILVLVVLVHSSKTSINEDERNIYQILQASFEKDWDKVLELTNKIYYPNQLVQYEINRALYHTGSLLDHLFYYPQQFGEKGLFLEGNSSSQVAIHMIDFYYDLGFANETRHWATEAQMVLMRHPVVLKNLVISYIALGNDKAAEKYLRILSRSRLYREWCKEIQGMIENNTADDLEAIKFFHLNNPEHDFFAETGDPTRKLLNFYYNNLNNKMAFEYLIASYLLQHKIGTVISHISEFKKFGYERLPKTVEEAALIYMSSKEANPALLADYSVGVKTLEEFREFGSLMANTSSKVQRMEKTAKYRNTYWFYIMFTSPNATKN
jgi:hypothetical protein